MKELKRGIHSIDDESLWLNKLSDADVVAIYGRHHLRYRWLVDGIVVFGVFAVGIGIAFLVSRIGGHWPSKVERGNIVHGFVWGWLAFQYLRIAEGAVRTRRAKRIRKTIERGF